MSDRTVIHRERPDQPEVMALLADLDAYLGSLYEPEANHIRDDPAQRGRHLGGAFGGYPENGLPVFYAKPL
jgi:hypothetical protein